MKYQYYVNKFSLFLPILRRILEYAYMEMKFLKLCVYDELFLTIYPYVPYRKSHFMLEGVTVKCPLYKTFTCTCKHNIKSKFPPKEPHQICQCNKLFKLKPSMGYS